MHFTIVLPKLVVPCSQYLVPFAGAKIVQSRWCKDIPPPVAQQLNPGGANCHCILNNIINLQQAKPASHIFLLLDQQASVLGVGSGVTSQLRSRQCTVCNVVALLHLMSWYAAVPLRIIVNIDCMEILPVWCTDGRWIR